MCDNSIHIYHRNKSNKNVFQKFCHLLNQIQSDVKNLEPYLSGLTILISKEPSKVWHNFIYLSLSKTKQSKDKLCSV